MIIPGYDEAGAHEQGLFRAALQKLMYEGSVQRVLPDDRNDYDVLLRFRDAVSVALGLFDTDLVVDESRLVIGFRPLGDEFDGYARLTTQDEMVVLMVMRAYLETEFQSHGEVTATLTAADVTTQYAAATEGKRTITRDRLAKVLRVFRRLKLVYYTGAADQDDTSVQVLPLLAILTADRLEQLADLLEKKNTKGGFDE